MDDVGVDEMKEFGRDFGVGNGERRGRDGQRFDRSEEELCRFDRDREGKECLLIIRGQDLEGGRECSES